MRLTSRPLPTNTRNETCGAVHQDPCQHLAGLHGAHTPASIWYLPATVKPSLKAGKRRHGQQANGYRVPPGHRLECWPTMASSPAAHLKTPSWERLLRQQAGNPQHQGRQLLCLLSSLWPHRYVPWHGGRLQRHCFRIQRTRRGANRLSNGGSALTNNLSSKTYLQGLVKRWKFFKTLKAWGTLCREYAVLFYPHDLPVALHPPEHDGWRHEGNAGHYGLCDERSSRFSDTLPARHSWITGEAVNYQMFPKASDNMVLRELANMADRGVIGTPSKNMRGRTDYHPTVPPEWDPRYGKVQERPCRKPLNAFSWALPMTSVERHTLTLQGWRSHRGKYLPLQGKRAYEINKVILVPKGRTKPAYEGGYRIVPHGRLTES